MFCRIAVSNFLQAPIGRHRLILDTQKVEGEQLIDRVGILDAERERLEITRLHHVGRDLEAGRRVAPHVDDQRTLDSGDEDEVEIARADRSAADDLRDHVEGEEADRLAVGRRFTELVAADQAAGAADVLHHDGRVAGNLRRQVLRDDAPLDVGRTAGRIVDDHGDRLALVELGCCAVRNGREGERRGGNQHGPCHGSSLPGLFGTSGGQVRLFGLTAWASRLRRRGKIAEAPLPTSRVHVRRFYPPHSFTSSPPSLAGRSAWCRA